MIKYVFEDLNGGKCPYCPILNPSLAGDFNIITHPTESSNYNGSQVVNADIRDFKECISALFVTNHAFIGLHYTWFNHQHEGFLAKKMDRVLVNDIWLTSFPQSSVEFLTLKDSYHYPASVQLFEVSVSPSKLFKILITVQGIYFELLITVEDSWRQSITGILMSILNQKLKRLK